MKPQTVDCVHCSNAAELWGVSHISEQVALQLGMDGLRDRIHAMFIHGQCVPVSLHVALSVLERGQDALEQTWGIVDALPRGGGV